MDRRTYFPVRSLETGNGFTDYGGSGRFEIQPFFQQDVRGQRRAQIRFGPAGRAETVIQLQPVLPTSRPP